MDSNTVSCSSTASADTELGIVFSSQRQGACVMWFCRNDKRTSLITTEEATTERIDTVGQKWTGGH